MTRLRITYIGDPRSVHTERWVRWFARRHDVSLIATAPDAALADLTVATLPAASSVPGGRLTRSLRVVRSTLDRLRPDIVHGHYVNEAGWFAAASGRRPIVVTAWGSDLYRAPSESRLARRLNPWAVRAADWVTCDSADQVALLRSWGVAPDRISAIGWGVDRGEFHPGVDGGRLRAQLGIPTDARLVLSPRQWLANSNIEAVVEAHARLPEHVHLLLKRLPRFEDAVADGVAAAVEASPARERIHVLGEVEMDELPALYAAADVVVSLCTTDGTPVSVLEAMATGRPVVALRNASVAEWVAEPGGRLVAGLDPSAVADSIGAFLRDEVLLARAAAHNVAVIAERADRSRELGRMDEIYSSFAGKVSHGG